MSNETYAAAVAELKAEAPAEAEKKVLEPAQVEPEPVQETAEETAAKEAEAQAKAEKRQAKRERKEYYELKAKAEFLEREIERARAGQPEKQVEAPALDIEQLVEQKLAERELTAKKESIFAKAEKDADFDRADFLENTTVTPVMADAILDSDAGDKIIKHLYLNQEEAERIASLSPARQAAEIGKLEALLATQKPTVKKSGAPAPISPIAGKSNNEIGYRSDMSDADFAKARREKKLIR